MNTGVPLLAVLFSCCCLAEAAISRALQQDVGSLLTRKIIGGTQISLDTDRSFIASLRYSPKGENPEPHVCGGALIAKNVVITAAHCVSTHDQSVVIQPTVHLNRFNREGPDNGRFESYKTIKTIVPSTYYSYVQFHYDVALLVLDRETGITPVEMLRREDCFKDNSSCGKGTVYGWGLTNPSDSSSFAETLMEVQVPFTSQSRCNQLYGKYASSSRWPITDTMMCAGEPGKDSCINDSGGPLMVQNKLAGIVSFGADCGGQKPGVYSNVPFLLKDWIEEEMRKLNIKIPPPPPKPQDCFYFFGRWHPTGCP